MQNNNKLDDIDWDTYSFGFSLVDEDELEKVQQLSKVVEQSSSNFDTVQHKVDSLQDKIDNLYNAIAPLLNNLKRNPEKEYILWPNRVEKVEEFEQHLQKLYNS